MIDRRVPRRFTDEFETMWADGKYHSYKTVDGGPWSYQVGDAKVEVLFSPQHKPLTTRVRRLIQTARHRIDVAVFFLTHKGIAKDLINAHRRGVLVRIIIDATAARNGYTKHELLRAAGIPVKVESWGGKMHMKSAVIDDLHVITGSMNWTSAGEGGNDENTLIIQGAAYAEQYAVFFEQLWSDVPDKWLEGGPDPESRDSGSACFDGMDNDFDHQVDPNDPGCGPQAPPLPRLPPWEIVPKAGRPCFELHRTAQDEFDG